MKCFPEKESRIVSLRPNYAIFPILSSENCQYCIGVAVKLTCINVLINKDLKIQSNLIPLFAGIVKGVCVEYVLYFAGC